MHFRGQFPSYYPYVKLKLKTLRVLLAVLERGPISSRQLSKVSVFTLLVCSEPRLLEAGDNTIVPANRRAS